MFNMDVIEKLRLNTINYKTSLDRIIDKYSKIEIPEDTLEVDFNNTSAAELEHLLKRSKKDLQELQQQNLVDRDQSLRAHNVTTDSQFDLTYQSEGNETVSAASSSVFSVEHNGTSSMDESRRTLSDIDHLPEDEDKELEMTLRSHGTSLVELYPIMISKMERALDRQKTSQAAGSVLRRYRKWRQQPKKSSLNSTFIVPMECSSQKKRLVKEDSNTPVKSDFRGLQSPSRSPLKMLNSTQGWHTQQQSPGKIRDKPILVMEPSGSSPWKRMNKNFNMPQVEEKPCALSVSPSRPLYSGQKPSLDLFFVSKRLSSQLGEHHPASSGSPSRPLHPSPVKSLDMTLTSNRFSSQLGEHHPASSGSPSHPLHPSPVKSSDMTLISNKFSSQMGDQGPALPVSPSRPIYTAPKTSLDMFTLSKRFSLSAHSLPTFPTKAERTDIYSSPVKQNPSEISIRRSPSVYPMSPRAQAAERFPRDPSFRQRSASSISLKMLHIRDSFQPSLQLPPPPSPQPAPAAVGGHSLRRHSSFDSSQLSRQVDEDIKRLYQKFFCQSRSYLANRAHSSTALAALALSPHRPLPRKRLRDLSWSSPQQQHQHYYHHQSKRSREEQCPSSPGPRGHGREMLRQPYQSLRGSPGRHSLFQSSSSQQRSRDAYQDSWMS